MALAERVGEPDLDERLSGDAEATGFAIDLAQQIHREVHVHTLNGATGPDRLRHAASSFQARHR